MFKRKFKIGIIGLLFLLGVAAICGALLHRSGILQKIAHSIVGSEETNGADIEMVKLDTFYINIPDSSFSLIAADRELAMQLGHLYPENRTNVAAVVKHNGSDYIAKVRLKGDLSDHWAHEYKWSFRVDVKQGKAIDGIKIFNLQRPETRGNLNEWVFHQLLKHNDLIYLRYKFCNVVVNGKDCGIYALEEHFDKRLIENNDLREGPVFKLNTSYYWNGSPGVSPQMQGAPIKPFKIGKQNESNPIYRQFLLAKDLVEGFRQGKLKAGEVFDINKLGRYMAIIDLTGHHHASVLDNVKFYYNPISALIEPIGYDNSIIKPLEEEYMLDEGKILGERRAIRDVSESSDLWNMSWYDRLFSDAGFYQEYMSALNQISSVEHQKQFWENISEEYTQQQAIFKIHDPNYKSKVQPILEGNASYINRTIHPSNSIHAYVLNPTDSLQDGVKLLCSNIHSLPVRINCVRYKDGTVMQINGNNLLQAAGVENTSGSVAEFHFQTDSAINYGRKLFKRLTLNYSVLGMTDSIEVDIFRWDKYDVERIDELLTSKQPNWNDFPFLEQVDPNTLRFKKGTWTLDQSLVIPKGTRLIIEAGSNIKLENEAAIVSFNAISILGTADEPVVISAADSTGQGILVLNAEEKSFLNHVVFKGLSRFKSSYWELPGAVSFYESDVEIQHAVFNGNRIGDDYLNIVRSDFKLSESQFINVNSDAFDGDFVHGEINNVTFDQVGNDGIDFSGSLIELNSVTFSNIGDKAISGGERSKISGQHVLIENAELAITSKDDSEVVMKDIEINNSRVGYCAFEKKAEFGRALIRIESAKMTGVEVEFMIEKNSQLYLDKKQIESNYEDVKAILYGNEYGKSSK